MEAGVYDKTGRKGLDFAVGALEIVDVVFVSIFYVFFWCLKKINSYFKTNKRASETSKLLLMILTLTIPFLQFFFKFCPFWLFYFISK